MHISLTKTAEVVKQKYQIKKPKIEEENGLSKNAFKVVNTK